MNSGDCEGHQPEEAVLLARKFILDAIISRAMVSLVGSDIGFSCFVGNYFSSVVRKMAKEQYDFTVSAFKEESYVTARMRDELYVTINRREDDS